MDQTNDIFTNMSGSALEYSEIYDQPTARCNSFMAANGIPVEQVEKNKMKVLAQLVPTYTYSETDGTVSHKACTLPAAALRSYNIDTSTENYNCMMNTTDNVSLRLASGKSAVDVVKGCVVPFSYDETKYKDGDVYSNSEQVQGMLDTAYKVLDADTIAFINGLRQKVTELTATRDKLKSTDLPKSQSEKTAAHASYMKTKADCDYYAGLYTQIMSLFSMLLFTINLGINRTNATTRLIKSTLKSYHKTKKIGKLIRNIKELSFVTFFEHIMRGFGSHPWQNAVLSGGARKSYSRNILNISNQNINKRSKWAGGVLEVPWVGSGWNDKYSSVFFPPGMTAEGYEHINYGGYKITFTPVGYPTNVISGYYPDFRQAHFNDKISSLKVYGGFNSAYWDDTEDFAKRVDNPFTTAAGRPAIDGTTEPTPEPPKPPGLERGKTLGDVGGRGGGAFEFVCSDGSYINKFSMRSGAWIDRIAGKCSNGKTFGPYGGGGGGPREINSDSGFTKLGVYGGHRFVDNIQMYNGNNALGGVGGRQGSSGGGGGLNMLDCGSGKIIGIRGGSGAYVDRLGIICSK